MGIEREGKAEGRRKRESRQYCDSVRTSMRGEREKEREKEGVPRVRALLHQKCHC